MSKQDDKKLYEQLSEERKQQQELGLLPDWYTTSGWQMFKEKYLYGTDEGFKGQATRIARTAARHMPSDKEGWEKKFFEMIWKGWLSCSTPVLANMGTTRGMPVSCTGHVVGDSIHDFYMSRHEAAMLTKFGFGTSGYFGNVRSRGNKISRGGKADGAVPVIRGFMQDMINVSQGSTRRGSYAAYLPIDHGDFSELANLLETEPDGLNVGWNISQKFIDRLNAGDHDALERYQRVMKIKATTGKGYFWFDDKVNAKRPQMYVDRGLTVKASNLCTEITLFSDQDHSFTCVLSSLNVAKYDEWKDTDTIYNATVFLDCVAAEFIEQGRHIPGFEKAIRFTEKGRALGLGVCGFHTYLQSKMMAFEGFEAHSFNNLLFKQLHDESLRASQWMAKELGEPEWCKGYGVRNTHRIAIAPTMSTAALMGGVSQGIEPVIGNIYTQASAGGEFERINPEFLKLMKERGQYKKKVVDEIAEKLGSVQHLEWLTPEEKMVFRTAFEIDQRAILRLASARGRWIDQWQSLNLFFAAEEKEEYISQIHQEAFLDSNILGLYYMRTQAGVLASKDECVACSG